LTELENLEKMYSYIKEKKESWDIDNLSLNYDVNIDLIANNHKFGDNFEYNFMNFIIVFNSVTNSKEVF
jgi:hypothetical protein